MARGWESKAVEAQIEEGKQRKEQEAGPGPPAESRAHLQRLESLRMSRSRLLEQLDRARHSAHREGLLKGLRAIEREIEEMANVES